MSLAPRSHASTLDKILRTLGGDGARTTDEGIQCRCPAHSDDRASLSVTVSGTGKLLWHCHAGCNWESVLKKFKELRLMPHEPLSRRPVANLKDVSKHSGKELTHTYTYYLETGEEAFQKLRYVEPDGKKTFRLRKTVNGQHFFSNVTKGIKNLPLYNQNLLRFHDKVYIVEGEKDCDTLQEHKLLGVTNFDGAVGSGEKNKWRVHYNLLFKDKDVVVVADNDIPGLHHAQTVAKNVVKLARSVKLVTLSMLEEHGDTTDYITQHGILKFLEMVEQTPAWDGSDVVDVTEKEGESTVERDGHEARGQDGARKAIYEDYIQLYQRVLGDVKVDIFSGTPMAIDPHSRLWQSALNRLAAIRSEALQMEEAGHIKFNRVAIEDHFIGWTGNMKPRFLVDIPEWDGVDRINLFASCLELNPAQGFSLEDCDNLITDWLVKAYRRLENPSVRNRILILKGKQNIGKDWWIDSLVSGAGQFTQDLSIVSGDKDSYLQLSRGLFLKISEFDRTARTEVSVLKDMVTKPYTDIRGSYERDIRRRDCRASFISSCNIDDILRDHTGSTRYIVLDVANIRYEYPVRDKNAGLQIMAQAKYMADGWTCPSVTEEKLARWLGDRTPDNPLDDLVDAFNDELYKFISDLSYFRRKEYLDKGWIPNRELAGVIKAVASQLEVKEVRVRNMLKNAGLGVRTKKAKGYKVSEDVTERFENPGHGDTRDGESAEGDGFEDDSIPF